jgi:hypothetical protein
MVTRVKANPPQRRKSGARENPGVAAYLCSLPQDDTLVKSVSVGVAGGGVWVVTEVEARGSVDALSPLFAAELEAQRAASESRGRLLTFRILDRSLKEELSDGPREFVPIR